MNKIYWAVLKLNHVCFYLALLEKHSADDIFSSEIDECMFSSALQILKEYSTSSQWQVFKQKLDNVIKKHKKVLLTIIILIKKAEIFYLQSLFTEKEYKEKAHNIYLEIIASLASNTELTSSRDETFDINFLLSWAKFDCQLNSKCGAMFSAQVIMLTFTVI